MYITTRVSKSMNQHFRVYCFLLPCGFWGSSSKVRLGNKTAYLLNYLTGRVPFEMVVIM